MSQETLSISDTVSPRGFFYLPYEFTLNSQQIIFPVNVSTPVPNLFDVRYYIMRLDHSDFPSSIVEFQRTPPVSMILGLLSVSLCRRTFVYTEHHPSPLDHSTLGSLILWVWRGRDGQTIRKRLGGVTGLGWPSVSCSLGRLT